MHEVVILSAVRTPIAAFQGAFKRMTAPQLGAAALTGAMERSGLAAEVVEQVYMGCVLSAGVGQAPARQAALAAGFPHSTGAVTVNKVCGSGMKAVMMAANELRCEDYSVVAAGGMEAMSRAPYLLPGVRVGHRLGHGKTIDSLTHDGLWDPYNEVPMGSCGEICAREKNISREEQDAYALESYQRSIAAIESGRMADEIVPVMVAQRRGDPIAVERDEEPFRAQLDRMPTLRPVFDKEGTITAANASSINDGAAALVLTTAARAAELGVEPIARVVAHATAAQAPEWFTTAPIAAVNRVLERAGMELGEIDLFEINEAFAVVALAVQRGLGIDAAKLNVRGGAVALGHPIGCSGARIVVTLLHALREADKRYGCAAICLGGGEATAMIVERL